MGNYNPHNPEILGVEFVPFAGRFRTLDIGTEIGYSFSVTGLPFNTLDQVQLGTTPPTVPLSGSTILYNIYPRGREDDTGEINVIRLPVLSVATSGTSVSDADSALNALLNAGDASYVIFNALTDQIRIKFDVPSTLAGKRILAVDFVYQSFGDPGYALYPTIETSTVVYPYGTFTGPANLQEAQEGIVRFGEVNPWWAILGGVGPNTNSSRFPWRYDELEMLDNVSPLYVGVKVNNLPLSGEAFLNFAALDVYFCEESRVRYGGQAIGQDPTGNISLADPSGSYTIPIRTTSYATSGTLSAGDYTITVTQADAGDLYNTTGIEVPTVTVLDELASHPGVLVEKFRRPAPPLPLIPPMSESTNEIAAVAMIGSGANLQAGEASVTYNNIVGAPVYVGPSGTSVTAVQQIHNEANPSRTGYTAVRFFARRFNPLAAGDLTVSVSGSGSATITPEEFAELDEITVGDYGPGTGWKEVTLPITATFSSDASFRNVTFSMTGVAVGSPIDQWQLITAGVTLPPDYVNYSFYPGNRYDGLQNANLVFKVPSSGAVQTSSNYTLVTMFAQSPIDITGVAFDTCTLEVTGIGEGCEGVPECIPTHILGNRISWGTATICDTFDDRREVDAWGNASETGQPWTNSNTPATNFDVVDGEGRHLSTAAAVRNVSTIGAGNPIRDGVILYRTKAPVLATGGSYEPVAAFRKTSDGNYYYAHPRFETNGTITSRISKFTGGAAINLTSIASAGTYTAGDEFWVLVRWFGSGANTTIQLKYWHVEDAEPLFWMAFHVGDTDHTNGNVGLVSNSNSLNTNSPFYMTFSDFTAMPLSLYGGLVEIQRRDDWDEDFQQIALLSPCNVSFCDFEARVGQESEYRLRTVNIQDFNGVWVSGVGFLPGPGVSGAGDANSVLIFTSNQDTDSSLAYVMQFEGEPVEEFTFPEAGQINYRTQYQKNYPTAFHGTERGGEVFQRDILVQGAAITPSRLANFNNLRNLAWDALPYVCVRDELGNRWFANVSVPGGRVRANRSIYIAQIQVTEVTDTPAPVDESS